MHQPNLPPESNGPCRAIPRVLPGQANEDALEVAFVPDAHCSVPPAARRFSRAPLARRGAAHLIDTLLPLPFLVPFFLPWILVVIGYSLLCDGVFDGRSPGKRLMGLRTVAISVSPARPCNPARSCLRNIGSVLAGLCHFTLLLTPLGLTYTAVEVLMVLCRPDSRRLGDLLAGTQVIAAEALAEENQCTRR